MWGSVKYSSFPRFFLLLLFLFLFSIWSNTGTYYLACKGFSALLNRVRHGYTAGTDFLNCTRTRVHRTRGGYGYIPYPFLRGIVRNPRYLGYPRVHPPLLILH